MAAALFISRKTVERPLANIYVKLDTNDADTRRCARGHTPEGQRVAGISERSLRGKQPSSMRALISRNRLGAWRQAQRSRSRNCESSGEVARFFTESRSR
jgi:DNA-binding NarL/FixJ family response regulator